MWKRAGPYYLWMVVFLAFVSEYAHGFLHIPFFIRLLFFDRCVCGSVEWDVHGLCGWTAELMRYILRFYQIGVYWLVLRHERFGASRSERIDQKRLYIVAYPLQQSSSTLYVCLVWSLPWWQVRIIYDPMPTLNRRVRWVVFATDEMGNT